MKKDTNYKSSFHIFQKAYINKYPNAVCMREHLNNLKNKSVLDVGCGSGIDMRYFVSQGAKVAGADIALDLLVIAKETVPRADIRNDSFDYLSWKDKSFDIVWSKYALNHTENVITPLKEIERVLKDDGVAYIQVTHPLRTLEFISSKDYFDDGLTIIYPIQGGKKITEPHHTFSSWVNAISEAGFTIVKCEEILNRPKEEYTGRITPSAIIFVLTKKK